MFVCAGSAAAGTERERQTERVREREYVLARRADDKVVRPRKTTIPMVPSFGGAVVGCSRLCVCVYHSLQGVKVECEGCWTENSNVEQLIRQTFFNELSLAA